jgi:hypothetical protein
LHGARQRSPSTSPTGQNKRTTSSDPESKSIVSSASASAQRRRTARPSPPPRTPRPADAGKATLKGRQPVVHSSFRTQTMFLMITSWDYPAEFYARLQRFAGTAALLRSRRDPSTRAERSPVQWQLLCGSQTAFLMVAAILPAGRRFRSNRFGHPATTFASRKKSAGIGRCRRQTNAMGRSRSCDT